MTLAVEMEWVGELESLSVAKTVGTLFENDSPR